MGISPRQYTEIGLLGVRLLDTSERGELQRAGRRRVGGETRGLQRAGTRHGERGVRLLRVEGLGFRVEHLTAITAKRHALSYQTRRMTAFTFIILRTRKQKDVIQPRVGRASSCEICIKKGEQPVSSGRGKNGNKSR